MRYYLGIYHGENCVIPATKNGLPGIFTLSLSVSCESPVRVIARFKFKGANFSFLFFFSFLSYFCLLVAWVRFLHGQGPGSPGKFSRPGIVVTRYNSVKFPDILWHSTGFHAAPFPVMAIISCHATFYCHTSQYTQTPHTTLLILLLT